MDVKCRVTKAMQISQTYGAYRLKPKSGYSIQTLIGVLLYGSESCKVTNTIIQKLDTFQTRCIRKILTIFWEKNKISNERLYKRTQTAAIYDQIKEKRWKRTVDVLRKETSEILRVALRGTPSGKRCRRRPKKT